MIIGMSMDQDTCRIVGQVSLNLLYGKKNLQKDKSGRPDHLWPELWKSMGKNAKLKERSRSGPMKSSILTTHENCEGSISSTRRIRNSKKPSRMLVRNWKHLWLLLCPAKL